MSDDYDLPPEVDYALTSDDRDTQVRRMLLDLLNLDMSPKDISEAMDGRVSPRTIYRWVKNDSSPQNERDLRVLARIHAERTGTASASTLEG